MNQSPSIASLAAALAKAQLTIGAAAKSSVNQDFGSRYADIAATIEACKKPLAENGISTLQPVSGGPSEYCITTILLHESGEFLSEELKFTALNGIHPTTGLVTSWSRYALRGILNIPCADDDGNAASSKPDARQQQRENSAQTQAKNPPAPIPPAAELNPKPPVMLGDSWADVICHVGETTKGKTVGELTWDQMWYYGMEWKPKNKKDFVKNTNLINACNEGILNTKKPEGPETTEGAPQPADETEAPAQENAPETPTDASARPTMEWRSVQNTIGKTVDDKGKKLASEDVVFGSTLGDIAIRKWGSDPKRDKSGAAWLRLLFLEGIPFIEAKGEKATIQEKILVNAIKSACEELKPFDAEVWLKELTEDQLRAEITRRLTADGIDPAKADAVFDAAYDPLAECNEIQLRTIIKSWATILPALKGVK